MNCICLWYRKYWTLVSYRYVLALNGKTKDKPTISRLIHYFDYER